MTLTTIIHHDPSIGMVDTSSAIEGEEDEENHLLETHCLLQESAISKNIVNNNAMLPSHSPNHFLYDGDGDVVLLYRGFDRSVWQGLYIGSLTFFVLNSSLIFLVIDFSSFPTFWTIPWIVNLVLILPVFLLARVGLRETKDQEQLSNDDNLWEVLQLVMMSSLVFMGWLWGIQSFYQQLLFEEPVCDNSLSFDTNSDGSTTTSQSSVLPSSTVTLEPACDWAYSSSYFQIHAIAGPVVLITATFNFMKFSRGLVFPTSSHVWIGRIHNILLMVSALGGIFMGILSEDANWLDRSGLYVLLIYWMVTMLMGWHHIVWKDIELHKRWMTRNYTLTMLAVTLRLYKVLFMGKLSFSYTVYLSLIHPVLIEVYLQRKNNCDRRWWLDCMGMGQFLETKT